MGAYADGIVENAMDKHNDVVVALDRGICAT